MVQTVLGTVLLTAPASHIKIDQYYPSLVHIAVLMGAITEQVVHLGGIQTWTTAVKDTHIDH